MKKSIGIIVISLILCGIFMIDANAMKVNIPFDYCVTPSVRVYAEANNGIVSVKVCMGGFIIVTDLESGSEQKIKHICYEDIYWVNYIDDEFVAFSENYMMKSTDGYNWNTYYDNKHNSDGDSFHALYGVDTKTPSSCIGYIENKPEFEVIDSVYQRNDGLNVYVKIVYTGQEWLKFEDTVYSRIADNYDDNGVMRSSGDFDRAIYRSSDRQNWEYIDTWESNYKKFESGENSYIIPFPGFRYDADIQIINTGKEYLARSTTYDTIDDRYGYSQPIFVYDYNFNNVKTIREFGNIVDMSYVDNIYYLTNSNSITYSSTDLENWEIVGENLACPISNGSHTIYKTRYNLVSDPNRSSAYYSGTITTKNGFVNKDVVTEGVMLFGTGKFKDFFVAFDRKINENIYDISKVKGVDGNALDIYRDNPLYDNTSVSFSKDGVYWATLDIPEKWSILRIDMTSEGLVIECNYDSSTERLISVKFSDMEQVVPQSDIYVELNNRILGFAQPPVMEDDRTLVPMRFLFEQMGAEVDWNEATQTATATVPVSAEQQMRTFRNAGETQNSVTFSIDNLNATVNGELETMDVPARLINDQTFVPLRFLSENLGYNVEWDENTNTAIITTE